jgi:hypothetical protein
MIAIDIIEKRIPFDISIEVFQNLYYFIEFIHIKRKTNFSLGYFEGIGKY